jgi:hypothetical protein
MDVSSAVWRKSSYSSANGGACVEIARLPGVVAVRDSQDPDGPKLMFSRTAWLAFTAAVRDREFNLG